MKAKSGKSGKPSIQKLAEAEISSNLLLDESVLSGIANFRAVARKLRRKIPEASVEALAISTRRYFEKARRGHASADEALFRLLSKAKIKATTEVADFTLESGERTISKVSELMKKISPKRGEIFHFVAGYRAATLIVDMENFGKVSRAAKGLVIDVRKNVAEISIITGAEVERVPGWVALVSRLLARNGINMLETLSCYTETILIIKERDVGKVLTVLSEGRES
ncbi:MAG: ACT domain-containing protein [archaeon]